MDIHISVRNLVEFILRSGDIDNRKINSTRFLTEICISILFSLWINFYYEDVYKRQTGFRAAVE